MPTFWTIDYRHSVFSDITLRLSVRIYITVMTHLVGIDIWKMSFKFTYL